MSYKILAIDDHPETLDIVVLTLKRFGYQVISSLSPVKGIQLAQDEQPDLILLDVNMPDMDGLEVCRRLRAHPQLTQVPIIMFTAEDEPYQKLAGFDAGADDYLTKPTDPDEMIARIEGILGSVESAEPENKPVEPPPQEKTIVMPSRDEKVSAAPPTKGGLVAILGARGGAGATITAINLAASIARIGYPTTLVDFDMVQGHIALYLNQHIAGSLSTLAEMNDGNIEHWLSEQLIPLTRRLRLLPSHPNQDGRYPQLPNAQINTILDILVQSGQYVVADLGRAGSDCHRAVLDHADQVLVCLPPERVALSAAKQLLRQLQNDLLPFSTLNAIIIDIGSKMTLPRKAVETFLDHPLQAIIPITPDELTKSVNKGAFLIGEYSQGQTARHFYQLAKQFLQT
jgi:CheY-like chemotaxis protein